MTALVKRTKNRPRNLFEELFDDNFENLFSLVPRKMFSSPESYGNWEWNPRVDVRETNDALIFEAELPGMNEDDVEITVESNVLTIKGERKLEKRDEKESYHRMERHYGCFQRTYTLTNNIDVDGVKASYRDGILEVTFPKKEEAKPKKVTIGLS